MLSNGGKERVVGDVATRFVISYKSKFSEFKINDSCKVQNGLSRIKLISKAVNNFIGLDSKNILYLVI